MSSGPETISDAFVFGDFNQPAPATIAIGMAGQNGDTVHIVSSCEGWKSLCKFTGPTFADVEKMLLPNLFPHSSLTRKATKVSSSKIAKKPVLFAPEPILSHHVSNDVTDPCNQYTDCVTCIAADPGNGVQCGWCRGGFLDYNATGPSTFQCGGFVHGEPALFICPLDFLTETCSGWSCNYTASEPTCEQSSDGTFSTQALCETNCQTAVFAKCNLTTKTCDTCQEGTPGCTQTQAECNAICSAQRAKCNNATSTCSSCDPSSDPDCTQTAGDCATSCKSTNMGICNQQTGQCSPCKTGDPGCVAQCNSSCSIQNNSFCDKTNPLLPTCKQGGGNQSFSACAANCKPPAPPPTPAPSTKPQPTSAPTQPTTTDASNYGCDYSNATNPVCSQGKGTQSKTDCLKNCQPAQFALCNYSTGTCASCTVGSDPNCKYTKDYCIASCKKIDAVGVFRGNQINKNYLRGEYDFTFNSDGTVAFWLFATPEQKYEATYTQGGSVQEGVPIIFTMTMAPSGGPLPVKVGDILDGLFLSMNDQEDTTTFLYLGLGIVNNPAVSFDDAMSKLEFVLAKCLGTAGSVPCDFSPAAVPE